ncbi:MAG TPA: PAS domain S-box protein [Acidimicrobiales bacterium]|nr:PAS domain S-box protein [Acidimicrobiales bacterium]
MSSTELPSEVTSLQSSSEALVVVDQEGVIALMTEAAEALFEVASADIVGEFVEMLVPEKKRWGHQAYRRGFQAEPNDREMDPGLEPELERPMDGTLVPIHVRLEPLRVDGRLYVVAHVTERTD